MSARRESSAELSPSPCNGRGVRGVSIAVAALALTAGPAFAQSLTVSSPDGRRQMVASRLSEAMTIDGRLNEPAWSTAAPASGFIQSDPLEGQAASEDTEVRIVFDDDSLYVGVRCHDSDPGGIVVNEIRKDFAGREQDTFEVLLDTYADRRNGFVFATNARGAKSDTQIANEGRDVNPNWDAVWWVAAQEDADGWTAEFRIPFKTLRFQGGDAHLWGINFARRIRRKNEVSYWSPVSRAYTIYRASSGGDLNGLPPLEPGRNLRIKPFVLGEAVRSVGAARFDRDAKAGVDVKAGVTPSLTLDITVNPDFAQAEADEQQVNLTQFSLFYPEKREFFLENSGIFYFGDIPRNTRQVARFRPPEEDLLLFFSRRIGLSDSGEEEPLYGGVRLTGRAGRYGVGLLTMQGEPHGDRPSTNYTALRVRRDVLANSDVGAIFLSREPSGSREDFNRVGGVDANFRFFKSLSLNGFAARSDSPAVTTNENAAKGSIGWEDSDKRLQASIMTVGEGFRDDLGFIRRTAVTRQFYDAAWLPQPEAMRQRGIRQLQPHARVWNYYDPHGDLVTRSGHVAMQVIWNNGSTVEYAYEPREEAISTPFTIYPGISIPAGRYDWDQHLIIAETDHSRALSGSARLMFGDFWSGTQRTLQSSLLFRPTYRLVFDFALQISDIVLHVPEASFVTNLASLRTGYSFNTNMFLDSLIQYRTDVNQFSANVRFNLIHHPLSDFFVVYNESQYTDGTQTAGRGLVVKFTQMLAF